MELQRDGFIIHIGHSNMEFDYNYYANVKSRDRIKYCLTNQSSIFHYEVLRSSQIKRNLHRCHQDDLDFNKYLIVRLRINPDLPKQFFTEN